MDVARIEPADRERFLEIRVSTVWATLETWLLGDGDVAELAVGDALPDVGLRLNCSTMGPATGESVVGALELSDPLTGTALYRLRGTCRAVARTQQSALLELADAAIVVEPADVRPAPGSIDPGGLERYSDDFLPPEVGRAAQAQGWLDVVPSHEWDDFELPDARRDWVLAGILLVRHEMVAERRDSQWTSTTGGVLQVDRQSRLRLSADTVRGNRYLVDLRAASPPRRAGTAGSAATGACRQ